MQVISMWKGSYVGHKDYENSHDPLKVDYFL